MNETRELLLFAHDHSKTGSHPVKNLAALPKPFDLVTHQPDGWSWGKEELTNPWFRIVVWHNVSAAELDALLSPMRESGGDPGNPSTLYQYRGFSLSFDEPGFAAWWTDDKRVAPKYDLKTTNLAQAKKPRLAIANPAFIGLAAKVIG